MSILQHHEKKKGVRGDRQRLASWMGHAGQADTYLLLQSLGLAPERQPFFAIPY
jgi:hypothetical protein